jgi:hypothetical protein
VNDLKVGDLVVTRARPEVTRRALIIGETQVPNVVNVLWLETGVTGPAKKQWFRKLEDRGV